MLPGKFRFNDSPSIKYKNIPSKCLSSISSLRCYLNSIHEEFGYKTYDFTHSI